jgi:hypothetical protein
MAKEQIETNNIVKISSNLKERDYIYSTAIRMRPEIYNKYKCIIWQVLGSQLAFAKNTLYENCVKYWGLEPEEYIDENGEVTFCKPIKVERTGSDGGGYTLTNMYEIKLIKIAPIKHIK